ncbi:MAG: hypothetical protein PHU64_07645 [Candidatus Omnitrophica bacterium]|nr:hypothetical protein [Candidatus Omnitrophota bacterium]MDD5430589.1 hypothetical protein [Candidatus Omnitrophota bacterium]
MNAEPFNSKDRDDRIEKQRRAQREKVDQLSDYLKGYSIEMFLEDIKVYFDNEVDFDMAKIRLAIETGEKLNKLIDKAKKNKTHPVVEFLKELFSELGRSGNERWPEGF